MELIDLLRSPATAHLSDNDLERAAFRQVTIPDNRFFSLDAEDIAEGGASRVINSIAPFLAEQNTPVTTLSQVCNGGPYTLTINGVDTLLYSQEEIGPGIWELSVFRLLDRINALLSEAQSSYRGYHLGGGEDGWGLFLTDDEITELRNASHSGLSSLTK